MTRIKGRSSKIIIIDTKYAADLIDLVSKNKITYDKVKLILMTRFLNQLILLPLKNQVKTELSY